MASNEKAINEGFSFDITTVFGKPTHGSADYKPINLVCNADLIKQRLSMDAILEPATWVGFLCKASRVGHGAFGIDGLLSLPLSEKDLKKDVIEACLGRLSISC